MNINKNAIFKLYLEEKKKSSVLDLDKFLKNWNPIKIKGTSKKTASILTFDTETTTAWYTDKQSGKIIPLAGFVCMGQFCLDGHMIYCRTADECVTFFEKLNDRLDGRKIRCYVHNLGYDYHFIKDAMESRGHVVNPEAYLGDKRTPIYCEFTGLNIVFCCSLKLFDKKLESIAKDYNLPIKKGNGWDYNKFRTTKTKLNDLEIEYGMHDVYLLYLALQKKIELGAYKNIWNVPWTKTGEVRYYRKMIVGRKDKLFKDFKEFNRLKKNAIDCDKYDNDQFKLLEYKKGTRYYRNHRMWEKKNNKWYAVSILTWDNRYIKNGNSYMDDFSKAYELSQKAFLGGFTHANQCKLGRHLHNIASYDLTSAYPSVMLVKKFVYHWKHQLKSLKEVEFDKNGNIVNDNKGYMLRLKFKNVHAKHGISVISSSKVEGLIKAKTTPSYAWIDNGRILHADEFILTCYDTDYNTYRKYYDWESVEFLEGFSGQKVRLLDSDIYSILHFYEDKCKWKAEATRLKDMRKKGDPKFNNKLLGDATAKLNFAKQQLNSVYGCAAMDKWKYYREDQNREYFSEFCEIEKKGNYNTVSTFTIGGQVTSYVREQILSAIAEIGFKDMVYSDTDSIKFENKEKHEFVFNNINKEMQNELSEVINELNLDTSKWGEQKDWLNQFDYEGSYTDFKTLGAKRYIHTTNDEEANKITMKDAFNGDDDLIARFENKGIDINKPFIECTTAGCKKDDMLLYLWENSVNLNKAFTRYSKGLEITDSKKQTTLYKDSVKSTKNDEYTIDYMDYKFTFKNSVDSNITKLEIRDSNSHLKDIVDVGNYIILYTATFKMKRLADDVEYAIGVNINSIIPSIK